MCVNVPLTWRRILGSYRDNARPHKKNKNKKKHLKSGIKKKGDVTVVNMPLS